jgi:hypothetical protein
MVNAAHMRATKAQGTLLARGHKISGGAERAFAPHQHKLRIIQ